MGNSVMLNGVEYAGEQIAYKDSTYELVSKVAYLIGVPLRIFQNEHEPPKIEIYNRLEQDKNARIIRNLCIIRTAIERNYRKINDIMTSCGWNTVGFFRCLRFFQCPVCSSFQMTESALSKSRVQSSATTLSRSTG